MSDVLTVPEVADYLNSSTSSIYRYCKRGLLTYFKTPFGLRFERKFLEEFLSRHKRKALLFDQFLKNALTNSSPIVIDKAKGGNSKLAKKGQTCFNYGFGRVYVRTYKSGRSSWTISYYNEDSKRIQKSVPQAQTKEEAAFALQQEVQKAFDRRHGVERRMRKIGFRDFAKIFLEDYMMTVRRNFKPDVYRLHMLCDYFKDADLRIFSPLMIERFRKSKLKDGRTKSTCNRYLQLLKRMFNVAREEGYVEENVVGKVKLYSEKDNLKERILTEAEEEKLMETCSDTLRPILVIALNTGMRRAEILNLKWNQIDFKARRIRVEKTKSEKVRFVPINDSLFHELKRLRDEGQSPFVFLNPDTGKPYLDMKTGFKGACKRAGINNLRFHDLRHTFASRLVEKGVDIETVKELLGHHSITITQRYIHSTDERKKAAVELLGGKIEGKICDVVVTQENQSKLIH